MPEPRSRHLDTVILTGWGPNPRPEEPRGARLLEGWPRVSAVHPSFETHRCAMLPGWGL